MAICISLLHGLAAPLLHDGRRRRRQRHLRHHDDDHRGADRREDLQLAVHDVRRPGRASPSPMLWSIGFMVTFVIGGMTGVLLAVPPADFVLHNSLFLVAHFHNVIIGGVLFGAFAGYTYWFPKAFGFTARRAARQGRLLVLVHRLLPRLHAALRARPDGHDAAHAALRRRRLAALAAGRGRRRGRDPGRDRAADRAARGQHPTARQRARRDRRSVGRPHARMGDAPRRRRPSTSPCCPNVQGEDAYWGIKQRDRQQTNLATEPDYEADRDAAQQRRPASSSPSSPRSWALR